MPDEVTAEQRLENIKNKSLELLELLEQELNSGNVTEAARVQSVGEALKALADGLKRYEKATKVKKGLDPEAFEHTPVVSSGVHF